MVCNHLEQFSQNVALYHLHDCVAVPDGSLHFWACPARNTEAGSLMYVFDRLPRVYSCALMVKGDLTLFPLV
jgi:hypothetical protein